MSAARVRILTALLIVAMALSLAGCQSIAEQATEAAVEQATGVDIEQNGDEVTITGEDGTEVSASSDGELPEGFPADVPVYEGAIVASVKAEGGYSVTIEASDDVATIFDWYKAELESGGWTLTTEIKSGDSAAISAEKGNQALQVSITPSGEAGKTGVTLFAGTK